jgi:protein SFI1
MEKAPTAPESTRRSGFRNHGLICSAYLQILERLGAALSFAQRCQIHVTSSALQVWHKRLATQQGANAFALQYANAQLQFRFLYRWRVQLRVHLKRFRQARIADKFFVVRRAWRIWVDKVEVRGREKRLRECNKEKARKLIAGTS